MQTLLDNLTSIQWWLGVVFVGICINLLSIFIKNRFDGYLSKTSAWWRNKSEKRKKEFEADVNYLKNNPQEIIMASFVELRHMNRAIIFMLLCIALFIVGISLGYFVAFKSKIIISYTISKLLVILSILSSNFAMIMSTFHLKKSINTAEKIRVARK